MRSQLTSAAISAINDANWLADYSYYDNGDMAYRTIQSDNQTFDYNGHIMTAADGNPLTYDENGQLLSSSRDSQTTNYEYNWDGKLRSAEKSNTTINLKYDPAGNRIRKDSTANGNHKYIVDAVSDVPKVLLVLDANDDNTILKTYIHTDTEVLMQHNGSYSAERYYYLHDRLGSVRLVIDDTGSVVNSYTYDPWGRAFESETDETIFNPYRFSGYFWDDEPEMYYCINRYYDPRLTRFTSRDPVFGKFEEPMTLHKYLYCGNDSVNRWDPLGLWDVETHRSFGRLGYGRSMIYGGSNDPSGIPLYSYAPFDYGKLDIDYPAWKVDLNPTEYTWLHFMSREEIFPVLFGSSQNGDAYWFEYMMHAWQDSYVHYDAGYGERWGHAADWTGPDQLDWPWNVEHNSYNRADITTRIFEDIWIKNNMATAVEEGWLPDDYNPSSPWLSMGPRIYICGDDNEMVDIVDF